MSNNSITSLTGTEASEIREKNERSWVTVMMMNTFSRVVANQIMLIGMQSSKKFCMQSLWHCFRAQTVGVHTGYQHFATAY